MKKKRSIVIVLLISMLVAGGGDALAQEAPTVHRAIPELASLHTPESSGPRGTTVSAIRCTTSSYPTKIFLERDKKPATPHIPCAHL